MKTATPFNLTPKVIGMKGKPIDMSGREYLRAIYNGKAARTLLKFGRQSEKSTTLCNKISLNSAFLPYFQTIFVSSSASQAKEFSNERIATTWKESSFIADYLLDSECTDRVDQRGLLNGSNVYFRYAFHNADRCRGISSDMCCLDEIQDIRTDNIAVIEECVSHSPRNVRGHPYKSFLYAGTPKTSNNAMEFFWQRSTMREWGIKCTHCNHWNLELNLNNIGKHHLICEKCGGQIYPQSGKWIVTNPGATWDGFHVCQLQVPWLDWKDDIIYKLENYAQHRFFNEVLGLSYDSGSKPLTTAMMRACCDQERNDWWMYDEMNIPQPCFAGVDWALTAEKSYTVLTIGAYLPYPGKFMILFQKRYEGRESDIDSQIEDIKMKCEQYNAQLIGCDWGAGVPQNLKLMQHFGADRVLQFYNSGNQKARVKWNADRMMFTISRTTIMTDLFNMIEKGRIEFPCWAIYEKFARDFLNVNIEYNKDGVLYYDHSPDSPDDVVHSSMYAMLCGEMYWTGKLG